MSIAGERLILFRAVELPDTVRGGLYLHSMPGRYESLDTVVDEIREAGISNEYAGQLLMALYIGQAWNAHQKYRVFGNLESRIFRYGTGANHIRLAQLMMRVIREECQSIQHERVRRYALTKFIVLHFVGVLLNQSSDGIDLLASPLPWLNVKNQSDELECQILDQIRSLAQIAIAELNYYIREHGDENYDYKREFKSQKFVTAITNEILKGYEKDIFRKQAAPFSLPVQPADQDSA